MFMLIVHLIAWTSGLILYYFSYSPLFGSFHKSINYAVGLVVMGIQVGLIDRFIPFLCAILLNIILIFLIDTKNRRSNNAKDS